MAASANLSSLNDKNLEQCVVTFLEKVDSMEKAKTQVIKKNLPHAQVEMRTLQLWRSVISEFLAAFLYAFIVCGAAATSASAGSFPHTAFMTAAASGFTVCVLTYCFQNLSGAHINPAISISMMVIRKITPLRGMLFVAAQSGGAIAGAGLLRGMIVSSIPKGSLNAMVSTLPSQMSVWERVIIEFVLSFLIVFTYCVTMSGHKKWLGNSATCMGLAYLATGLVTLPTQNPVRAFGPAFVMNRWDDHWVFWLGPCVGGVAAALVFKVIFISRRKKSRSEMSVDGDSASIHSEADTYDDLGKSRNTAMRTINPNPYSRQLPNYSGPPNSYNTGFYPMAICKTERNESIYEGSRSLYTRSPPLTRANLSRSQSVYTKNTSGHNFQRDQSRPGPLYPAQSLYPMPSSNSNPISQNHQNQQRQGTENIYGTKMNTKDIYGKIPGRNESIYGGVKKDSNDNSYNSYISSNSSKITPTHVARKEGHQVHQNIQNMQNHSPHSPYYHGQPSPSSQY